MKKKTIAAISVGTVVLLAGVGFGIYTIVQMNASPVEVTKVSSLNTGWWGESSSTSGTITANATQEVYLDDDELVDQVYVEEGDEVKIGDALLSYDTTLLEIDLEAAKLERQSIRIELQEAKKELEELKNTTPVSDDYYSDAGQTQSAVMVQASATTKVSGSGSGGAVMKMVSQTTVTQSDETQPETQATEAQAETQATEAQPETQATEAQTEAQTETQASETFGTENSGSVEETEESSTGTKKAYRRLKYDSEPYKGSGTKADPYVFLCKEGVTIYASFINKILGFNKAGTSRKKGGMNKDGEGCYAVLVIRAKNSTSDGFIKSIGINGTTEVDEAYDTDITWTFTSDGLTKHVPDEDEAYDEDDDIFDDDWDDDWGDDWDEVYTASELAEAIEEKENEIDELKLDLREAKLNVKKAKQDFDDATVTATINGVVKSVGDVTEDLDGDAFITVTSSEGMYVEGTISELELGDVEVGSTMTGMAYESGVYFTAEITEISEYPTTADSWYSGEALASVYPFTAYIEDSDGLINNEWAELTSDESAGDSSGIYLYKAYIRSENGQSYVYKADEDGRLVKQYIKTGATLYSMYVEVKSGLDLDDMIAFPYGKNVKEGAKTEESDSTYYY